MLRSVYPYILALPLVEHILYADLKKIELVSIGPSLGGFILNFDNLIKILGNFERLSRLII